MASYAMRVLIMCLSVLSFTTNATQSLDEPGRLSFSSTAKKTQLLELYSSQGCSSCPPAENWISQFADSPDLFKSIIPVVFHVDYWNYLGWKDPYSEKGYSARQRNFRRQGYAGSVYTPGFMVNGEEWRGWFLGRGLPSQNESADVLDVELTKDSLSAQMHSKQKNLRLHFAVLGMDISTYVNAGENKHRKLNENFIVLTHQSFEANSDTGMWKEWKGQWQAPAKFKSQKAKRVAAALWVTEGDDMQPIQATGGWLPRHWVF